MKRSGFTLIELLMVVVVISVLLTIVTTMASNAIRTARDQKNEAMRMAFESAIATYQATDSQGHWPGALQGVADSGRSRLLTDSEAQNVFRIIVQKSTGESGQPLLLIDPHSLYVAPAGAVEGKSAGRAYDDARRGDAHHRKLGVAEMEFGWQHGFAGKFFPFHIAYHAETDSVSVYSCCGKCIGVYGCTKDKENGGECVCH